MPISAEDELALSKAATIANQVMTTAIKYAERREPLVDTIIAQHVKVQLAVLQSRWSRDDKDKTIAALEDMGNGLSSLGASAALAALTLALWCSRSQQ